MFEFVQNIISTFAGTDSEGYSGDGGSAASAQLSSPFGVSADMNGNVYIVDYNYQRIRKVNSAGIISTFAGGGGSYIGDGGDATSAQLFCPNGVSADISGNVYIADTGNHRIRKVNSEGVITTFAGTGTLGYFGDGGVATSAKLYYPYGVAADISGNVYIAIRDQARIRKVNSAGIITTFAGGGGSYIGDGGVAGIGDGGAATSAQLSGPWGLSADINGNVYIADSSSNRVRKVNSAGIITTLAGTGTLGYFGDGDAATLAQLNYPIGVSADINGNVYIADCRNNRIRMVNGAGIVSTFAGTGTAGYFGDGDVATLAQLNNPIGVSADMNGNVYIVDNYRIRHVVISLQTIMQPSGQPSRQPSRRPSKCPSCQPSTQPTHQPSPQPSSKPSGNNDTSFIRIQPNNQIPLIQFIYFFSFVHLPAT